ncbi:hypothetical protein MRX96_029227 [Rhipicephalus microplus]
MRAVTTPQCACKWSPCSCSSSRRSNEYHTWRSRSRRPSRGEDGGRYSEEEDEEEGSSSSAEDGTSAESALAGGGMTLKPQQHRKRCCDDDFSSLSTRLRCLLAAVIVLLVLTAVFVPLYYFVFREHLGPLWRTLFGRRVADVSSGGAETTVGGTTLDETLAPFPATPEWKPQCPRALLFLAGGTIAPVLEWNRFDCFPENPDVDLSTCEDRGCCWAVTNVRNDKDGPAAREHFRDHVPKCILPLNSGYRIAGPEESLFAGYEVPLLRIPSPSRYGDDITHLKVRVHMQTPYPPKGQDLRLFRAALRGPGPRYPRRDGPRISSRSRRGRADVRHLATAWAATHSVSKCDEPRRVPSSSTQALVRWCSRTSSCRFRPVCPAASWTPSLRTSRISTARTRMYMCIEKDNSAHAVLLLNSNAMEIQLQPTPAVTFRTTGGVLDFYFFMGPTPEEVVRQYTEAVGRPMMPPYWALGFHLGRWGYRTTDYVRDTQKKMRDMNMPQDVAHVDKDILYKQRLFTLDQNNFAKLPDLVKDLHGRGQRFTVVMEPGVAVLRGEPGPYVPLESGERLGVFVNDTWGTQPIQGLGWPGNMMFPDFGNPVTQAWWSEQLREFHQIVPFDGLWITGNEPSNYANGSVNGCLQDNLNQPPYKPKTKGHRLFERTLCMDSVHWFKGTKHCHYNLHNLYGKAMSQATVNALNALSVGRRSLVMSRSTFLGSGRYVGHWLGDNASRWPDLGHSIIAMLEFGLFGIPLVGADVCGFYDDANEELCLRWMQLGIFYPLVRNNNAIESSAQDPSAFSEDYQAVARSALKLRYELLPFLYTLFHHAHTKGTTVARPLFHVFPNDTQTYAIDKQFMWGEALLMTPVLEPGVVSVEGYFPAGKWYDYHTGREFSSYKNGQWLPVYSPLFDPNRPCNLHVRGGTVIPTQGHANTTTVR